MQHRQQVRGDVENRGRDQECPRPRDAVALAQQKIVEGQIIKERFYEITGGGLAAYEATSELSLEPAPVETPLERTTGMRVSGKKLTLVPILRAGLGMVQPFLDIFPDVSVGYIGLERDHTTAVARSYYCKLPQVAGRRVLLVDPMLATGGSAVKAIDVVRAQGGSDITLRFIC